MPDGKPEPKPVKLIAGVMFTHATDLIGVNRALEENFGPIDSKSDPFDFSFTDYYEKEMGAGLTKRFYSFEKPVPPDTLAIIKKKTNDMEKRFAVEGRRTVNIDPGYIEESKLVLASTKNFSHRIYLGEGIWGEVTLRYESGEFVQHPWTYPDYVSPLAFEFFQAARAIYRRQLWP